MKHAHAKIIAEVLVERLQPWADRIHIAGSIRRLKNEVKDIEIVVLPKTLVLRDLFEQPISEVREPKFVQAVNTFGLIIKGNPEGRMMQINLPEGIMLDLFIPEPYDYFRQLAIRTGSAEYSHGVIAQGWRRRGWVGTSDGLRRMNDCIQKDLGGGKTKWICTMKNPTMPPEWKSEEEFFEFIKVKYVEPQYRNYP